MFVFGGDGQNCRAVDRCIVISEILDSRTRNLISELNISEYVMSNEIISMALAMVSENASVNQILKELFTEVRYRTSATPPKIHSMVFCL
jgi:hypothetical protein